MSPDAEKRGEVSGLPRAEVIAQRRRIFTISNFVSLSRVIALPFLLHAISLPIEEGLHLVIGLSIYVALTDLTDGFIARRLNQVSDAGKVIDPIADKLCIGTGAVWLTIYRGLPAWVPVLIIGRDVLIVTGGIVLARKADLVLSSHLVGRATTVVLTITFFSFAIDWTWPQEALVWTSAGLIVTSFLIYLRIGWHILWRLGAK